jgi:hypothetical protein
MRSRRLPADHQARNSRDMSTVEDVVAGTKNPRTGSIRSDRTEIRLPYTLPESPTAGQEDKSHRAKRLGSGACAEISLNRAVTEYQLILR